MNDLSPAELLELYLLGELDGPQVERVEQWLASDPNAERELQAARELLAAIDSRLTNPDGLDAFRNRIVAVAESERSESPFAEVPSRKRNRRRWLIPAIVALTAVVGIVTLTPLWRPANEPPFEGPLPPVLADAFAAKPWFVRATGAAEYESTNENQLTLQKGEVEVSSLKPCEVVTPFARIAGSNVRFLVLCGDSPTAAQAVRVLVLAGTLAVENANGRVEAKRGDIVIARPDAAPERAAVTANNAFAIDLYRQLASGEDNLLFSPYSAHAALAMAAAGARGETAREMETVLHFPDVAGRWGDKPERSAWQASLFHSGAAKLLERIQRANDPSQKAVRDHLDRLRAQLDRQNARTRNLPGDGAYASYQEAEKTAAEINRLQNEIDHFELNVANGGWLDRSMPIHPDFATLILDGYRVGEFHNVDFRGAPAAQRKRINQWVSDQTRGRIQDLLSDRAISNATRMVLVNAIYFRGEWEEPFRESRTRPENFQLPNGQSQLVPLMRGYKSAARYGAVQGDGSLFDSPDTVEVGKQDDPANYPDGDGFLMAEMAYDNSGISMVILVPQNAQGLSGLEAKLSDAALDEWLEGMQTRRMQVQMPRFRLDAFHALRDPLQKLGVNKAFQPPSGDAGADFTGIADRAEQLFIGAVVQKAFIEVNEKGTVAAAATGLALDAAAALPETEPFIPTVRADRPFLFLLRDQDTGAILFMGRVMKPAGP